MVFINAVFDLNRNEGLTAQREDHTLRRKARLRRLACHTGHHNNNIRHRSVRCTVTRKRRVRRHRRVFSRRAIRRECTVIRTRFVDRTAEIRLAFEAAERCVAAGVVREGKLLTVRSDGFEAGGLNRLLLDAVVEDVDIHIVDDDREMRPFPGRHRIIVNPAGRARRIDRRTRIRAAHPEITILVRDIKTVGIEVRRLAAEEAGVLLVVSRSTWTEPAGQRKNLRVLRLDAVEVRRLDAVALVALTTRTRIGLAEPGRIRRRPALLFAVELMRRSIVEVAVQVPDADVVLPDRRFIHLRSRVDPAVVGGDFRRLRERRDAHPNERFALGVPGVDFVVEDGTDRIREAQVGRNAA